MLGPQHLNFFTKLLMGVVDGRLESAGRNERGALRQISGSELRPDEQLSAVVYETARPQYQAARLQSGTLAGLLR